MRACECLPRQQRWQQRGPVCVVGDRGLEHGWAGWWCAVLTAAAVCLLCVGCVCVRGVMDGVIHVTFDWV